jgi:hypothetical protein
MASLYFSFCPADIAYSLRRQRRKKAIKYRDLYIEANAKQQEVIQMPILNIKPESFDPIEETPPKKLRSQHKQSEAGGNTNVSSTDEDN